MLLDAALSKVPGKLYDGGNTLLDWLYIDDAVDAILRVVNASKLGHAVYDVGTGTSTLKAEVAEHLLLHAKRGTAIDAAYDLPAGLHHEQAATGPLESDTGWSAHTPLTVGLPRFVDWYRAYHGR